MDKSGSWKTWVIIIGFLIFAGVASAAWIWFSNQDSAESERQALVVEKESEPITIQVKDYVLGTDLLKVSFISENIDGLQVDPWMAFLVIFGIVAVAVGAIGTGLGLITFFFSKIAAKVYGQESYQTATATLGQRQKSWLQEHQQGRSKTPEIDSERRSRWSFLATSILIIILVWITGLVLGVSLFGDTTWEIAGLEISAVALVNLLLILITAIILYLFARSNEAEDLDGSATDNQSVNWGVIWIILSGLLIVGLGTGAAIALRASGAG